MKPKHSKHPPLDSSRRHTTTPTHTILHSVHGSNSPHVNITPGTFHNNAYHPMCQRATLRHHTHATSWMCDPLVATKACKCLPNELNQVSCSKSTTEMQHMWLCTGNMASFLYGHSLMSAATGYPKWQSSSDNSICFHSNSRQAIHGNAKQSHVGGEIQWMDLLYMYPIRAQYSSDNGNHHPLKYTGHISGKQRKITQNTTKFNAKYFKYKNMHFYQTLCQKQSLIFQESVNTHKRLHLRHTEYMYM